MENKTRRLIYLLRGESLGADDVYNFVTTKYTQKQRNVIL